MQHLRERNEVYELEPVNTHAKNRPEKEPKVSDDFLTLSQKNLVFTCLQNKLFETTGGKGEIARKEHFLPFPQCFLSV